MANSRFRLGIRWRTTSRRLSAEQFWLSLSEFISLFLGESHAFTNLLTITLPGFMSLNFFTHLQTVVRSTSK